MKTVQVFESKAEYQKSLLKMIQAAVKELSKPFEKRSEDFEDDCLIWLLGELAKQLKAQIEGKLNCYKCFLKEN